MELRQLRYLVALADERHFTRAARREHVAQPALSQQLRRLEAELGLSLVERTTRRVALTEAGERLVERARRVVAEIDAARDDLEALAGIRGGRVAIGAIQALGPVDLPRLLAEYHRRYPAVELAVRDEPSDTLATMLRSDALDLAFLSASGRTDEGPLELRRLATEPLVAALPRDHRLAGRRRLRLEELRDERFVEFRVGATMRELLVSATADMGFEPQIAFECNEFPRIRALVARGLGVAVVPRSEAEPFGDELAAIPFTDRRLRWDVTLAWRAGRRHSPAAAAFLELAAGAGARA